LLPVAATALAVAGIINLVPYYQSETKPRWDLAAAYLAENVQPGDVVITNNASERYVLAAYADRVSTGRYSARVTMYRARPRTLRRSNAFGSSMAVPGRRQWPAKTSTYKIG